MRLSTLPGVRNDFDEVFQRMFGNDEVRPVWSSSGYEVPTDVFHHEGKLVIRMDMPEVKAEDVEVAVQENWLLIKGSRRFPYEPDHVRFVRRGTFYGDFTQRISLGKGLDTDKISARYNSGVLELTIPYADEVKPRKVEIQVGDDQAAIGN